MELFYSTVITTRYKPENHQECPEESLGPVSAVLREVLEAVQTGLLHVLQDGGRALGVGLLLDGPGLPPRLRLRLSPVLGGGGGDVWLYFVI